MKQQLNLRVSTMTRRQLDDLTDRLGTSITETITVAVDRLARQELDMDNFARWGSAPYDPDIRDGRNDADLIRDTDYQARLLARYTEKAIESAVLAYMDRTGVEHLTIHVTQGTGWKPGLRSITCQVVSQPEPPTP